MVTNDVISIGCVHLSTVTLLLELTLFVGWDANPVANYAHVLLDTVEDSSEVIDR
jgi:hypothetical protein